MHLPGRTEETSKKRQDIPRPCQDSNLKLPEYVQARTSSLVSLCEKIIMCSSVNELGAIALLREELYKLPRGCVQ